MYNYENTITLYHQQIYCIQHFNTNICIIIGVTLILNVSRIFNMCIKTDTGYINYTIRKNNISKDSEYTAFSSHMS